MQFFKKLVGDRIYLSPKGTTDEELEKFTEWMNDFQVTDYTGRSTHVHPAKSPSLHLNIIS